MALTLLFRGALPLMEIIAWTFCYPSTTRLKLRVATMEKKKRDRAALNPSWSPANVVSPSILSRSVLPCPV